MPKPQEIPPAGPRDDGGPRKKRERRRARRIGMRVEGRIVFAGVDTECIIHDMSPTGATVECMPLPALAADVALDVPDVGFARGIAVRHLGGNLVCIELATTPDKRQRFADKLILAAFRFPPDA
jgi:hypothetical protein